MKQIRITIRWNDKEPEQVIYGGKGNDVVVKIDNGWDEIQSFSQLPTQERPYGRSGTFVVTKID